MVWILFPVAGRQLDDPIVERGEDSIFGSRLDGMTSGESSERWKNESMLSKPEACCPEMTAWFVFYSDDRVKVAADGESFGGICWIMNDVETVEF